MNAICARENNFRHLIKTTLYGNQVQCWKYNQARFVNRTFPNAINKLFSTRSLISGFVLTSESWSEIDMHNQNLTDYFISYQISLIKLAWSIITLI